MSDIEILSARLNQIEKRLRWMKRMAVAVCISLIAAVTIGQAFSQKGPFGLDQLDPLQTLPRGDVIPRTAFEGEVRATKFFLVDDDGKERASLVPDDDGSVYLIFFDQAGKNRVNLSFTPSGPSLAFYDPNGQARAVIGSTSLVGSRLAGERTPPSSIALFDREGRLLSRQ
jgi:hypothetical protein